MGVTKMEEKRAFKRLNTEVPVEVKGQEGTVNAYTFNISGEGAGITLEQALNVSQNVGLRFTSQKGFTCTMEGKIIWIKEISENKWRVGVNIINPRLLILSQLLAA